MDKIGDVAILRAQLADAQADAKRWLAVAGTNEERVYVRRMQGQLGDLERILDRVELRGASDGLDETVREFLEAFRRAGETRGCVVGACLGPLAARLGKQAEQSEGGATSKSTDAADGPPRREENKPLAWQEIEITFLSDERVEIRNGGNSGATYNYNELGFGDQRGGKPIQAWAMLRVLAERGGEMRQAPAGKGRVVAQKRIEEIRKNLRRHFGIDGNPIPFNGGMYKTSFRIGRRPSVDT